MAAAASSSQTAESFLGSTISLISKAGIRYEGVCFFLDPQHGLLGLTDVKIFGTEGRRKDNVEILPVKTDYDTLLFWGSEIKELQVISLRDIPSTPALPDDPFVVEYDNPHPYSTSPQVANTTADIESRLCSLLQGISSTSQSLWSSGFWAPSSTPPVANLDGLGLPTYFPGLTRSPGVISRPRHSQGLAVPPAPSITAEDAWRCAEDSIHLPSTVNPFQKSILGPCPRLNISATQALESAPSSSDWESNHELQQQSLHSPSGKEDIFNSLSGVLEAGKGEIMLSEVPGTNTEELGISQRHPYARGSQGSQRGRGAHGSYRGRGNNGNGSRGRRKMVWAPVT